MASSCFIGGLSGRHRTPQDFVYTIQSTAAYCTLISQWSDDDAAEVCWERSQLMPKDTTSMLATWKSLIQTRISIVVQQVEVVVVVVVVL